MSVADWFPLSFLSQPYKNQIITNLQIVSEKHQIKKLRAINSFCACSYIGVKDYFSSLDLLLQKGGLRLESI